MTNRDWFYIGEPIPPIDSVENADFILGVQKAMLSSLVKRNLLTYQQTEQVAESLERKNNVRN